MARVTKQQQQGPKRAAIYPRVSTKGQEEEGTSLGTQEQQCREYALRQGYVVDDSHVYREVHTGTELWERPQLTKLREAIRARAIDLVVVYAIDRLSRDPVHLGVILSEADHAGVAVQFVTEPLDDSPEGQLIRFVRGYAAKVEHEKIKERSLRGKLARVQGGKMLHGGRPLYGYKWANDDKSQLVSSDREAMLVRRIFSQAAEGRPLLAIAKQLTAEGIPTPRGTGAGWAETTLSGLLHHPGYKGEAYGWRVHRQKVQGHWRQSIRDESEWVRLPEGTIPPLVDPVLWEAVQRRLASNRARSARNNKNPERFLLRGGYLRCGECGKTLAGTTATGANRRLRLRYRCISAPRTCPCDAPALIDAGEIDAAVWAHVEQILTKPEILERELARVHQEDTTQADREAIERSLAQISRQQTNLSRRLSLLDDDEAAAPLVADLNALAQQKKQLEAERDALLNQRAHALQAQASLDSLQARCRDVAARLQELTYDERRLALDALGIQATVWRADHTPRFRIAARIPVSPSGESDAIAYGTSR